MSSLAANRGLKFLNETLDHLNSSSSAIVAWSLAQIEVFCKLSSGYTPGRWDAGYHYPVLVMFWIMS